jgi:hypothetical protein
MNDLAGLNRGLIPSERAHGKDALGFLRERYRGHYSYYSLLLSRIQSHLFVRAPPQNGLRSPPTTSNALPIFCMCVLWFPSEPVGAELLKPSLLGNAVS